jgi:hypothetical protein
MFERRKLNESLSRLETVVWATTCFTSCVYLHCNETVKYIFYVSDLNLCRWKCTFVSTTSSQLEE